MSTATYLVLIAATAAFFYRLAVGPSLAARVIGVNGILLVGMVAIVAHATFTGIGSFLPVLVVIALVGFVGTAIIARFIEGARPMIGEVLVLGGALLTLLSAIGVVRFDDVLARMHALTKASTLGVLLAIIGAAIALSHPNDVTSLLLAGALQLLTSPVAANLLGRATYLASGIETDVDALDEHAGTEEHDG